MTKTINAFTPDRGELEVTISAGNVTNVTAFTTAEDIVLDGALISARRVNDPQLAIATTNVTGDRNPIRSYATHVNDGETWEVVLVDDYWSGAAGEWGTDNLSAVEILKEFYENDEPLGGLALTPAGSGAANIQTKLQGIIRVISMSKAGIDANTNEHSRVTFTIGCDSSEEAAHG